MCENLKTDRLRCGACRTINLAKHVKQPKPDMQLNDKCTPMKPIYCGRAAEVPLTPTCIKVCTAEEFKKWNTKPVVARMPHYAHGRLMYALKASILAGAIYFTHSQGVWGDQRDVTECIRRWSEYVRSINTRRPPAFDRSGKVVKKETVESLVAPMYEIYKSGITTFFSGVVKVPLIIKCAYIDYLNALEKKYADDLREAKIRKRG